MKRVLARALSSPAREVKGHKEPGVVSLPPSPLEDPWPVGKGPSTKQGPPPPQQEYNLPSQDWETY